MNIAQAHEQEGETGGIQATLHIDPADHPVVGHEAKFFFKFTDPDKAFDIHHCDCKIFLFQGENIIDQKQVSVPHSFLSSFGSYPLYTKTFDQPGDYSIHFSGQPLPGYNFDVFALHYDVHVAPAGSPIPLDHHSLAYEHLGHIIIFGGGLVASIILYFYGRYEQRKRRAINHQQDS